MKRTKEKREEKADEETGGEAGLALIPFLSSGNHASLTLDGGWVVSAF